MEGEISIIDGALHRLPLRPGGERVVSPRYREQTGLNGTFKPPFPGGPT